MTFWPRSEVAHVTLKGPTHTPEQGDGWPNLESVNVGMRKELDLFANVRPVRIPKGGMTGLSPERIPRTCTLRGAREYMSLKTWG